MYGGKEELIVKGYTDAAFQTDVEDSKSQSGYVFCLNGGVVSWKSSKQESSPILLQILSTLWLQKLQKRPFGLESSLLD